MNSLYIHLITLKISYSKVSQYANMILNIFFYAQNDYGICVCACKKFKRFYSLLERLL